MLLSSTLKVRIRGHCGRTIELGILAIFGKYMSNPVHLVIAGTVMLAGTVGACMLLQSDPIDTPVYSSEVKGRLSAAPASTHMNAAADNPKVEVEAMPVQRGRMGTDDQPDPATAQASDGVSHVHTLELIRGGAANSSLPASTDEKPAAVAVGMNTKTGDGIAADGSAGMEARAGRLGSDVPPSIGTTNSSEASDIKAMPRLVAEKESGRDAKPRGQASSAAVKGSSAPAGESKAIIQPKPDKKTKRQALVLEKAKANCDRAVTSAAFSLNGSTIRLTLKGNAPMVGHYFRLKDPERIVLDLAGNWDISVPPVPSNRLIRSVRTGHHEDKTRLVFDMKMEGKAALVPINRNSLELSVK